jgi:hypothetical protein
VHSRRKFAITQISVGSDALERAGLLESSEDIRSFSASRARCRAAYRQIPPLNQDPRLSVMNEYSNCECTAPIAPRRPCPKNEICPACTDLTQVESRRAYPTAVRLDIQGVAEPQLHSTVGRPRTLTDQQIRTILEEYANYLAWRALRRSVMSQRDLARAMGVSPATISYAVRLQGKYKQPSPDRRQANTKHRRRALGRLTRRHLL